MSALCQELPRADAAKHLFSGVILARAAGPVRSGPAEVNAITPNDVQCQFPRPPCMIMNSDLAKFRRTRLVGALTPFCRDHKRCIASDGDRTVRQLRFG